jgi:hypothetical protein
MRGRGPVKGLGKGFEIRPDRNGTTKGSRGFKLSGKVAGR